MHVCVPFRVQSCVEESLPHVSCDRVRFFYARMRGRQFFNGVMPRSCCVSLSSFKTTLFLSKMHAPEIYSVEKCIVMRIILNRALIFVTNER